MPARKVILDVDPGIDDALALMLAFNSPEIEIVGITVVAGNVTVDLATRNTLAILDLLGAPPVPVAVGARKPLMADLRTATLFHGANGIGNIELDPPARTPVGEDAATLLCRLAAAAPGEVAVVALGPLTNIALATLADRDFASNVSGLIAMAGAVGHVGNATPAAEANVANDPEAAAAVLASGIALRLVDLGATSSALLPLETIHNLPSGASPAADAARGMLEHYGGAYERFGSPGAILHDPLAVAVAALPDLATFVPLFLQVETEGRFGRGGTFGSYAAVAGTQERVGDHWDVTDLEPRPFNAAAAREVDVPRFLGIVLDRLGLR